MNIYIIILLSFLFGIFLYYLKLLIFNRKCQICVNGKCVNGKCICMPGWTGKYCNLSTEVPYKLKQLWSGDNFISSNDWDFKKYSCDKTNESRIDDEGRNVACDCSIDGEIVGAESTHGNVCYGYWENLINTENNKLCLKIGKKVLNSSNRNSIKMESKISFNGGLFIFDIEHLPSAPGTWPALWLKGPDWPINGEIDIIEGANMNTKNQSTLHTTKGCVQDIANITPSSKCDYQDSKKGCGIIGPKNSFGPTFNKNGGGVFACEWEYNNSIKIWFFPRNKIPKDIQNNNPDPSSWTNPYVNFNKCPGFFNNNSIIINTTLCGDWAGDPDIFPYKEKCSTYIENVNYDKKDESGYGVGDFVINSIKIYDK